MHEMNDLSAIRKHIRFLRQLKNDLNKTKPCPRRKSKHKKRKTK